MVCMTGYVSSIKFKGIMMTQNFFIQNEYAIAAGDEIGYEWRGGEENVCV